MPEYSPTPGAAIINTMSGEGQREPKRYKDLRNLFKIFGIASHSYNTVLGNLAQESGIENDSTLLDWANKRSLFIVGGDATHLTVPLWIFELAISNKIQDFPTTVLLGGFGGQNQASIAMGTQPGILSNKYKFAKELIGLFLRGEGSVHLVKPWMVSSPDLTGDRSHIHNGNLVDNHPVLWTFGNGPYQRKALEEVEIDRLRPHWVRAASAILAAVREMHANHTKESTLVRIGQGTLKRAIDAFLVFNFNRWGAFSVGDDLTKSYLVLLGVDPQNMSAYELVARVQLYLAQKALKEFVPTLPEPRSPAVETVLIEDDTPLEFIPPGHEIKINTDSILRIPRLRDKVSTSGHPLRLKIKPDERGILLPIWRAPKKKIMS